jgi:amino acid adenylation domain-containing protein
MNSAAETQRTVTRVPPGRWPHSSILDVFEAVVSRFGDRIAIQAPDGEVSYAQLRSRASAVARALDAPSLRNADRVALLFSAGSDAVVGIFGALMAGKTYVPLDPGDPPSRVEFILRDSGASAILTHRAHAGAAEKLAGEHRSILRVDRVAVEDCPRGDLRTTSTIAPMSLFYTTGSTGQPKGVILTQRNVLHHVGVYSDRLALSETDRLSLLFTLSFSASNMDIFGALLNGATLCPYDVRRLGAASLPEWIASTRITVLHTVPTLFRHLAGESGGRKKWFRSVRVVDLGGEAVFPSDAKTWADLFPKDGHFFNHLGATEASVLAQFQIPPEAQHWRGALPAGPPASGMVINIRRENGSLCSPDEEGEVFIHSPFLCPGYWNRPDLTAAAFTEDTEREGWRIFKSGDRGKIDAEGRLHTMGRLDDRVKIRGNSVDPAEIEAALRASPGVQDGAVVSIQTESSEERTLAAYAVAPEVNAHSLHAELTSRLPNYMVPDEIIIVPDLPRTATGKIDRRTLSGPGRPRGTLERRLTPGEDAWECRIAALFARLIGLEAVGREENFFELGGTSLKAAELQAELRRAFGHEVPPEEFLHSATPAGVAAWLRRARSETAFGVSASPYLVAVRSTGSRAPLFLVHGAVPQAYVSPAFIEALGDDQPFYAFQARGIDGREPPHRSIAEMADAYIAAMRRERPEGPYCLGGICAGGIVAHEMAIRLRAAGEALAPLLLIDPPLHFAHRSRAKRLLARAQLHLSLLSLAFGRSTGIAKGLRSRVQRLRDQGRVQFQAEDSARADGTLRTALHFKLSILRHRSRPYEGATRVIASRKRHRRFMKDDRWRRHFTGDLQVFSVGRAHEDVLDPANVLLRAELRRILDEAHTPTGVNHSGRN